MQKLMHCDIHDNTLGTDSVLCLRTDCGFMELREAFTSPEQVALHQRASHCHRRTDQGNSCRLFASIMHEKILLLHSSEDIYLAFHTTGFSQKAPRPEFLGN